MWVPDVQIVQKRASEQLSSLSSPLIKFLLLQIVIGIFSVAMINYGFEGIYYIYLVLWFQRVRVLPSWLGNVAVDRHDDWGIRMRAHSLNHKQGTDR